MSSQGIATALYKQPQGPMSGQGIKWGCPTNTLPPAAYPNPHASPLAQRARKAETGPDAVLKLAQRTRRTMACATKTASGSETLKTR